jgi:hypothetical protein
VKLVVALLFAVPDSHTFEERNSYIYFIKLPLETGPVLQIQFYIRFAAPLLLLQYGLLTLSQSSRVFCTLFWAWKFFEKWLGRRPYRGLPPYLGEEVYAPQWPGELCWRERKLLVRPSVPDRSKGRGQTKCSPRTRKVYCFQTPEPVEDRGGDQDRHRVKKEKK